MRSTSRTFTPRAINPPFYRSFARQKLPMEIPNGKNHPQMAYSRHLGAALPVCDSQSKVVYQNVWVQRSMPKHGVRLHITQHRPSSKLHGHCMPDIRLTLFRDTMPAPRTSV